MAPVAAGMGFALLKPTLLIDDLRRNGDRHLQAAIPGFSARSCWLRASANWQAAGGFRGALRGDVVTSYRYEIAQASAELLLVHKSVSDAVLFELSLHQ